MVYYFSGGGGYRGAPRGGPRGGGSARGGAPRGRGGRQGESLKFEEEFDFESANAQFDKEEIERELKEKLVIGMNMSITASLDVYNIAVIAIFFFFQNLWFIMYILETDNLVQWFQSGQVPGMFTRQIVYSTGRNY